MTLVATPLLDPGRARELHNAVAAVCPILGISIGDPADNTTWAVAFDPAATAAQRTAAQTVISGHAALAVDAATVPAAHFFRRFTVAERQALWLACVADATGAKAEGLMRFVLAADNVYLPAPALKTWMDSLVPAVITAARETTILTP